VQRGPAADKTLSLEELLQAVLVVAQVAPHRRQVAVGGRVSDVVVSASGEI
jgi:hypothetical protein